MGLKSTCYKAVVLLFAIFIFQAFFLPSTLKAKSQRVSHQVRIDVPHNLSIASPKSHIRLAFPNDHPVHPGEGTDTHVVVYNVQANGMSQANGASVVSVELNSTFEGLDLQASFGSFSDAGGNTELSAAHVGFVSIEDSAKVLANKDNSSGNGRILKGSFPISFKAVSKPGVEFGHHSRQLTLTITDV